MERLRTLPAVALCATLAALTLSACATDTGDEAFLEKTWETGKDTTDAVVKSTTESMKKSEPRLQGFFEHLWD